MKPQSRDINILVSFQSIVPKLDFLQRHLPVHVDGKYNFLERNILNFVN